MSYDMNSGYHGYAMSKRAVEAYNNGEKPISKWTKSEIVHAVKEIIKDYEIDPKFDVNNLPKYSKEALKRAFLSYTSWHHTSSYCNETSFYAVDEDAVSSVTEETLQRISDNIKAEKKAKKKEKDKSNENSSVYLCSYFIWEGTKRSPVPRECINAGVFKGNWFIMNGGKRKSVDAKGFKMIEKGEIITPGAGEYYPILTWDYDKNEVIKIIAAEISGDKVIPVKYVLPYQHKPKCGYMLKEDVLSHPDDWIKCKKCKSYYHKKLSKRGYCTGEFCL